jgi:hypothetical protein
MHAQNVHVYAGKHTEHPEHQTHSLAPHTNIYTHTHTHTPRTQTHTRTHAYTHTHTTHTHIHTHTHTHTHTRTHTHTGMEESRRFKREFEAEGHQNWSPL